MKTIGNFFKGVLALILLLIVLLLKIPFFILYPSRVYGRKNLKVKGSGSVVACNHFSNFDVVFLTVKLFPNSFSRRYLAKRELSKNKFLNFVLTAFGAIFITRGTADKKAFREVNSALSSKKRVVIFPEGTRNKSGETEMLQIKSGVVYFAKKNDVPIIPIRMEKKARLFRLTRIYIGEAYKVGDTGTHSTEEEVKILEEKFNNLKGARE